MEKITPLSLLMTLIQQHRKNNKAKAHAFDGVGVLINIKGLFMILNISDFCTKYFLITLKLHNYRNKSI